MRSQTRTVWSAGEVRRSMWPCGSCTRIHGSVWYVETACFFVEGFSNGIS